MSLPRIHRASRALALALAMASASLPAGTASAATFEHDGIVFHCEVRGAGPWLLVVHGNGGDGTAMRHQVEFFSRHYRVVAMDGRDHGESGDSPVPLSFEALDRDEPHIDPVALEAIRVPTLVLAGEFDAIRAEHIPGSQLAIFNGATHMIPVEDPRRFNQRVASFFAGAAHGCH